MIRTLHPTTASGKTIDPVDVICATLSGRLAMHRSLTGKGYTVTHVPSGFAARTQIRRKKDAEDLMLKLDELGDWDFRNPHGEKWARQKEALAAIVRTVPRHGYY